MVKEILPKNIDALPELVNSYKKNLHSGILLEPVNVKKTIEETSDKCIHLMKNM